MSGPSDDLSGFAEQLLAVIDDGRRTATYKLAVLLALMDCCAEGVTADGQAPNVLATRAIARRVASLYWPQLRPFPDHGRLRQITNKSAAILAALDSAFEALPAVATWELAERHLPAASVEQVLDVVELTVAKYPLVRLQTIDGVAQSFLYDIDWGEGVTISRLRGGAVVRLKPGAGDQLIRLAPLLRPLVELHWVRMVADLNQLAVMEDDLRRHLFGAERVAFPRGLRRGLLELQDGGCFYCLDPLEKSSAVDHFIPWSRWPNDAVENLVISHPGCNSRKSDHLPGRRPLRRWAARLHTHSQALDEIAGQARWRSDLARTTALARSVYGHLPPGSPVWEGPGHVGRADNGELIGLLAGL